MKTSNITDINLKRYDDRDFYNLFKHKLKINFETCLSPRLSSVTGLVMGDGVGEKTKMVC